MLNYQAIGNFKNQIIFIHGNSQSLSAWKYVIEQPELNEYRIIAVDLPGHGKSFRSINPENDYTLRGMAKHLVDFLTQFENHPYILVGLSLGSNVIGEAAGKLKNCKGLILISPSIVGYKLTPGEILKPNSNVAPYFLDSATKEQLELLSADTMTSSTDEKKAQFIDDYNATDPKVRLQIADCVARGDYSDELENINKNEIPTAVLFGKEDKICFTDYIDKTIFPKWNNQTILIEDSGHLVNFDKPNKLSQYISTIARAFFN